MVRIALVGCGASKKKGVHKAKDLYTSNYFQLKKEYAEKVCDAWFILSAKYGLVRPDDEIESYDKTLKDMDFEETRSWAEEVYNDIHRYTDELKPEESHITGYEPPHRLVWLAGEDYVKPVEKVVMDREEFVPRSSLPFRNTSGIGKQMGWLKNKISENVEETKNASLGDFS